VLFRLAYLSVTNALASRRLLPMSDRDKDAEILAHVGDRRIHGALLVLGVKVATSTVWEILKDAGINPAPQRTSITWATFLRSQAQAIIAADFFETVTLTGARMYVLTAIEHATRRVPLLRAGGQRDAAPWPRPARVPRRVAGAGPAADLPADILMPDAPDS
jgi:hypothetical protein